MPRDRRRRRFLFFFLTKTLLNNNNCSMTRDLASGMYIMKQVLSVIIMMMMSHVHFFAVSIDVNCSSPHCISKPITNIDYIYTNMTTFL